jgi:bifunctional dethiobiotin synthetase / adenosylmethionine---8-amino-7-oxononanoate aminotransferase
MKNQTTLRLSRLPQTKKLCCRGFSHQSSTSLLLSKKSKTHIVFGANTDVGKTVVSTALVQANVLKNHAVNYVKPLQCGGSDEGFLKKYVSSGFNSQTLFNWEMPASPHLASRLENKPLSDDQVLRSLQDYLSHNISKSDSCSTFIETAGGVLSPSAASPLNTRPRHAKGKGSVNLAWGWSTQADLYKPLHLPAILVGDGRLGGISATISALESLITRGYEVHGIILIDDNDVSKHNSNVQALKEYTSRCMALRSGNGRSLLRSENSIIAMPPLPDISIPLDGWYADDNVREHANRFDDHLSHEWEIHFDILNGLREKGKGSLWWPFTQHQSHNENKVNATVIDGAAGDYFSILEKQNDNLERTASFDACSSWWTQGLGHGEPTLGHSAAAAAGKYGHIIFPDVVHEPAAELADRLLNGKSGPGRNWASRVFFTDDGSTAMEVAIKMGMRKFTHDREASGNKIDKGIKLTVAAQQDCYHGDTLGVMDVAEPSIFNEGQHPWYEPKGLFFEYPTVCYVEGKLQVKPPSSCKGQSLDFQSIQDILAVDDRINTDVYQHYVDIIQREWNSYESPENNLIGVVIIEPILLGAGGMKFIDPLWQRALMSVARTKSVPVIFDEVASGLYRIGVSSCREIIGANPDIAAYAKLLTGGIVPMSVTLATEDVFQSFLGDSKAQALLHGHSYTAHAVGCVSGIHALDTYAELFENEDNNVNPMYAYFDQEQVSNLSKLPLVQDSMTLGTVVAITLHPDVSGSGYASGGRSVPLVKHLLTKGIYARPLGNVVYIMVSPLTSKEECSRLCEALHDSILSLKP